jgi:hypothetical protein
MPYLSFCNLQVWDYVGDGYVHRLIQSSLDGKLVEVPSPEPSTLRGRGNGTGVHEAGGPSSAGQGSKALQAVEEERALNEDINMLEVCSARYHYHGFERLHVYSCRPENIVSKRLQRVRQLFEWSSTGKIWLHQRAVCR